MKAIPRIAHKGTSGAGASRISTLQNCTAVSTVASAIDTLWAVPIYLPAGTLDTLGFEVTTGGGAGNDAIVALFQNTSDVILYPKKLIVAGTEADGTSVAVKESTVSQVIDEGIYWLVYANGNGTVATVRASAVGGMSNLLGCTSTPTPITAISKAATYNSTFTSMLTSSGGNFIFPTGGAYSTAAQPLMWVKYSA